MTTNPKVSVLIPTYNYAHFLDETIQSVLNQTYNDYELIIVDNKSTEDTLEVVDKYLGDRRIHFYQNATNLGLSGNWNKCLGYATGEYIKFLCADDKFHPEMLRKFVSVMDENPTVN
jgi:glycosyltransferase involved in cell wall biosynthesis